MVRIEPKYAVATVFVAAMFINILDSTVVNVALPSIAADLGVPVALTASVNIGFLVAVAVAIPVAGWLGDRYGAREVFVLALGLFTAASAACGLAQSIQQLVIFRILQGIGGGLMTPVGMAMLYRTFPADERIQLSRIINIPIAIAPALGPILGGFLVERAGWRWIFGINVPIGLMAIGFTVLTVPRMARRTSTRLDIPGFLFAATGLAALMYAISEGPSQGWTSPGIWIPAAAGVILLGLLIIVEGRVAAPMLRLQLFGLRLFRSANLIAFNSAAGFLGAMFVYPLMLQTALGYTALTAGLMTAPGAVGVMIGTQIVARFYKRVGPRRLIAAGQALVAIVLISLALVMSQSIPPAVPIVLFLLLGIGQAHTFMPNQAAAFDSVDPAHTGAATALFNATRQIGSAVGVATGATVIATIGLSTSPTGDAAAIWPFTWALIGCAGFSITSSLIAAITVHDSDAAPSRGLPTADRIASDPAEIPSPATTSLATSATKVPTSIVPPTHPDASPAGRRETHRHGPRTTKAPAPQHPAPSAPAPDRSARPRPVGEA